MMRIIFTLVTFLMLVACNGTQEIDQITPEILQNIETSSQQEMLFGHYENVNTVYGGSYKGCCVLNKDRMKLAQFITHLYEEKTGEEFGDMNMLIGTNNDKILVYIEPSAKMRAITNKSYYVEINKTTAEVETFKLGEVGPN